MIVLLISLAKLSQFDCDFLAFDFDFQIKRIRTIIISDVGVEESEQSFTTTGNKPLKLDKLKEQRKSNLVPTIRSTEYRQSFSQTTV